MDCSHGRSGRRGRITITKYTPLVLVFPSFRLFICCVISWLGRYSSVEYMTWVFVTIGTEKDALLGLYACLF